MPRKKVDARVRILIENAIKSKTRSFFVVVGDRGKDQVANLHYILSKAAVKARPQVLWCYNKDLGFSTHRQKRMKQIKKLQARGLYESDKDDPFDLFISSTNIRWCYYKETHKVLGNTYGMCVLQDFEALTPNLLCRTIETVEGGGIVVLLLHTMTSLRQLYTLAMDVHARFRTEAHQDVVGRFNERFILSLASCEGCLVLDDELNVLPVSRHAKGIVPLVTGAAAAAGGAGDDDGDAVDVPLSESERALRDLKSSLATSEMVGSLVGCTRTMDQAKAVLTFAEAIAEKTLRSTVALTAGRGRGKSAALGLAIAAAVGYGYSNIFVTSPSPENLRTLFEFVFKGLEALAFKEHTDYEAVASTNPDFNRAIVRVNIFRGHRQTIQYIEAHDAEKLAQAELVVIDEAAAIPLPLVKALLGPYLVFLASTVHGYEGTGRSLSLKLIQQLRQQAGPGGGGSGGGGGALPGSSGVVAGRAFREVSLDEPIRYATGDAVEGWLNDLLCLDATTRPYRLGGRLPAPSECELFAVDRDALFSYHRLSEAFLHRMMSLFVSSHYKNTPNDLQLMSDAPAHRLFVLLGPQREDAGAGATAGDAAAGLPDVLCVIQVCLEGRISRESLRAALARGMRSSGDLIPWTLSQQFQDDRFAELSGARIVRIATHPDATRLGYGARALDLLRRYFEGQLMSAAEDGGDDAAPSGGIDRGRYADAAAAGEDDGEGGGGSSGSLSTERVRPRKQLPPLLVNVADVRRPERIHWLGVSYGLTLPLFNFWRRAAFLPAYLRQTSNELTAEHTCIMLRGLDCSGMAAGAAPQPSWEAGFVADFTRRYMQLLSYEFRSFDATLALTVLDAGCSVLSARTSADGRADTSPLSASESGAIFTPHDVKRLESYARNLVDYHMILDLLPDLARLYFLQRLAGVSLPRLQAGIVMGLGLQRSTVDALAAHFDIAVPQVLALFNKAVRKLSGAITGIHERAVEAELDGRAAAAPPPKAAAGASSSAARAAPPASAARISSAADDDDDEDGGAAPRSSAAAAASALLAAEPELRRYTVPDDPWAWAAALNGGKVTAAEPPRVVSVRHSLGGGGAEGGAAHAGTPGAGHKRRAEKDGGSGAASSGGATEAEIYDPRNRLGGSGDGGKLKQKKARA